MKNKIQRREFLTHATGYLALLPIAGLTACGSDSESVSDGETTTDESSSSTTETSGSTESSTTTTGSYDEATTEISTSVAWAVGGTGLITVAYPDDSVFETSDTCNLDLADVTTEGPCYFGVSERDDISDGKTGLPMQLCLQLVDATCAPLEGYLIEVWHCDADGIYSGDTSSSDDSSSFAGSFCTGSDSAAEASTWFRGEQVTDSNGRVNFQSCFPGWYRGRTIHIHYRVRMTNGGSDYLVSQLCFNDGFAEDICTTHSLYASRGSQDTPLAGGSDTVFPASGYEEYMLNIAQNSDGTLLAYKKIMISG